MVIFVSTEWIFSPKQCFGEHSAPGLASCSVTRTPISFFFLANSDTSLLCQIHNPKQCFGWTLCTMFSVMQCYLNTHIFFFLPTQTPRSCVRFIAVSGMYLACPQKTCWVGYPHPNSSIRVHVTPAPCASPDSSDSWKLWDGNQYWLGRTTTRRTEFGSFGAVRDHIWPFHLHLCLGWHLV